VDARAAFLKAAMWHGDLAEADALLAAHPALKTSDIHTAAVLGDDAAVRRFIAQDQANVTATSAPHGGDALNYLCLSKYLRLDPSRSEAFLRAAAALLDAGADPNTGFWTPPPYPERETALYGAAGVAHHEAMTRLLLARGADPNDGEAVYHSPESYDNAAMQALVETGRVTPTSLTLMLIRKHDWHDLAGARWLLEHGTDPNLERGRGWLPIHHALARDNGLPMFELLLEHGADPMAEKEGLTAVARAAREGRSDVLELFARRGIDVTLRGLDALIGACARGDAATARTLTEREPRLRQELLALGGTLLARFAGTCNAPGVALLLDLGVDVATPFAEGDAYWDEPKGSLAIHIAAWRACTPVVTLLIARGSPVDTKDAKGRTPLALAVKACVDSYWVGRRTPDGVRALLEAGASALGVRYPSGYDAVDALLRQHGAHQAGPRHPGAAG
jgi:ankyrin repeat protein